ncbi:MAG: TonB-dependent receptor [Blastocatellia bacterium]|nr:TonB-dependent receptor [Blastocatellia bacterium]
MNQGERWWKRGVGLVSAWLAAMALAGGAGAQSPQPARDLAETSLEELMNIEVTSVSKKEEKLFQTAAAIYVITQEDIRRSGLTSLPELLRMVPGLSVARIDGNKWAISSRGFNSRFANKMLVMIDGRSVYTPLFSGVFWEVQDLILDDVERIEIIRGPGATLWGANAVNGVINIITKHTKNTEGGLLIAGAGSEELGFGAARYGGRMGERANYRIYAKYFNRDRSVDFSRRPAPDRSDAVRGGFRVDWQATKKDEVSFHGDLYDGDGGQRISLFSTAPPFARMVDDRIEVSGGNAVARWRRLNSSRSDSSIQVYYDRTKREEAYFGERRDTFNFDFQHHMAVGRRQDMIWGLGYRVTADSLADLLSSTFVPNRRTVHLFNAFFQDEVTLVPGRARLTLGSKFEHNDYTGFEVQPNVRFLLTPSERQTIWAAVSRAVRTPSRIEDDIRAPYQVLPGTGPLPNVVTVFGDRRFRSEVQFSYEVGYRIQPTGNLSLDLATFYSTYRRLRSASAGAPYFAGEPAPPRVVIPLVLGNRMLGESYGAELSSNWNVTTHWKLSAGYTFLRVQLTPYPESRGQLPPDSENEEGNSPQHQAQLRSYLKLPRGLEFDAAIYRVGGLRTGAIPAYTRLDARFGWRATESLELSVGLQNLLDPRHPEFGLQQLGETPTQVERSLYGKVTWRF